MSVNHQRDRRDPRLAGRKRQPRPPFPPAPGPRRQARRSHDQAGLDQQQTILLETLRRADGGAVSYEELRDAGIEYPASVVSELELSGWPLERSFGDPSRGSRRLGVRLDPRDDNPDDPATRVGGQATRPLFQHEGPQDRGGGGVPSAGAALAGRARLTGASLAQLAAAGAGAGAQRIRNLRGTVGPVRARLRGAIGDAAALLAGGATRAKRTSSRAQRPPSAEARAPRLPGGTRARWIAPALLLIIAGIVAALIASGGSSATGHRGQAPPRRHSQGRTHATRAASQTSRPAQRQPTSTPVTRPSAAARKPSAPTTQPSAPATPVSPATAAQLETRGHALLAAGQLQAAVQLLRHAATATGGSVAACREPVNEACLTYGYALYDLGRALRRNHQAAAAVPILEDRLKIANQRPTVFAELQLARREAGQPTTVRTGTVSRPGASTPPPSASTSLPTAPTGSEGGD